MNQIRDNHDLLVQIQKPQEHLILELESGIAHLEEIFSIFIENAYYNNTHSLQDTFQMLLLQRISTNTLSFTQLYNLLDEIKYLLELTTFPLQ